MEGAVHRFVRLLRLAGLRISVSEGLDAMTAAAQPGMLADRDLLRSALGVTLVKDRHDSETFDAVFDRFFALLRVVPEPGGHGHGHDHLVDEGEATDLTLSAEARPTPEEGHDHGAPMDIREFFRPEDLAQQYNLHQEAEKIDVAAMTDEIVLSSEQASTLEAAARVELSTTRLRGGGTPGDLSTSTRPPMTIELTAGQEIALMEWLSSREELDDGDAGEAVLELRRRLAGLLDGLPDALRHYLESLLGLPDRNVEVRSKAQRAREKLAKRQRAELEEAVRRLVRSLHGAPRSRRRVSAAGKVDGGRTMRQSMRYDGVPFRPVTVSKAHDRPRLVVLADVSLSVRPTAGFTLQLVHGLQSMVAQIRSWAFVAELAETTDLFAEHRTDEALAMVVAGPQDGRILDVDADSDYGRVFGDFLAEHGGALNRRTTLMVLGDGRSNGHDPNLAAFSEMTRRVRETVWLTPEPTYSWPLGRCDLPLYADFCDRVEVVRDPSGLDRAARASTIHLAGGPFAGAAS